MPACAGIAGPSLVVLLLLRFTCLNIELQLLSPPDQAINDLLVAFRLHSREEEEVSAAFSGPVEELRIGISYMGDGRLLARGGRLIEPL